MCPTCGFSEFEKLLTIDKAPVSCAQLFPSRDQALEAGSCRLDIVLCMGCGHIWNGSYQVPKETFYDDDYYSSFTIAPKAQLLQTSLAKSLDELLILKGKTVLEVGCGDGYFLESLSNLGATAIGFEPSSTFNIAQQRKGIQVSNSFFPFETSSRLDYHVDLVVMRHVLEHLESPVQTLNALREINMKSSPPSFILIEVPNSVQLLKEDLYFDFYNDHIHYFSYPSLCNAARASGWTPIFKLESDEEFLVIVCKNNYYDNNRVSVDIKETLDYEENYVSNVAKAFRSNFEIWRKALITFINEVKQEGSRVAVWGAGARGVSLLSGLDLPNKTFEYVIDIDPAKHHKYLPVSGLQISSIERLREDPVSFVLVTSYTYYEEIWSQLEQWRSEGGQVIKIYPYLQVDN